MHISATVLYIAGFDLLIGTLFLLRLRSGIAAGQRLILVATAIIAGLVNVSGLFCGPGIVEAVVGVGGLGLAVLLLSERERESRVP